MKKGSNRTLEDGRNNIWILQQFIHNYLEKIKIPCLIIWGDKDKMTPEEFKKAMQVNKDQEALRDEYMEKEAARRS